jgi:hypothetical protein
MQPIQPPVARPVPLAARLESLSGKTIGLYSNEKLNAGRLLDMIAAELALEFQFRIVRGTYSPARKMEYEEWGDLDRCDAVILANGD